MTTSEVFGFLNHPESIEFNGGWIAPTDSFQDSLKTVNKDKNVDGYFYPPTSINFRRDEIGNRQAIPNTIRPAQAFQLPASHVLYVREPLDKINIRHQDAGLLIHLIGFLFQTRLQFLDWRFDGKVPVEYNSILCCTPDKRSDLGGGFN
jgi:hypothetical protein